MTSPLMQAVHAQKFQEASAWGRWAILHKVRPLPAAPADVAAFIKDCAPIAPIDEIWKFLTDVSRSHTESGFSDPTAGGPAASAMNAISKLEAPRSWPRPMRERFKDLPYDIQRYLAERDGERDKIVRRAQNEAADARRKLIALQNTVQGKSDDTKSETASA